MVHGLTWLHLVLALLTVTQFVTATDHDLLTLLGKIHSSPSFSKLPENLKLFLVELVSTAKQGQLLPFIDNVGFYNVVDLTNRM